MKKHVLIIEDCQSMKQFVSNLLSKKYQVIAFGSAEEALVWLRKSQFMPELILTGFNLAEMNGLEFIGEVRNQLGLKNIPILMLSSVKDSATRFKVLEAGASDYITKPFYPKELELRVAYNIEKNNPIQQEEMPGAAKPSPVSTPSQKPKSTLQKQISYLQRLQAVFLF
jgi:DNA-binding response OmpR family regulator